MKQRWVATAVVLAVGSIAAQAFAHGGTYQPPPPPDQPDPTPPPPPPKQPPPPPSTPGGGGGDPPSTPGGGGGDAPGTPGGGDDLPPSTPGGGGGEPPSTPGGGGGGGLTTPGSGEGGGTPPTPGGGGGGDGGTGGGPSTGGGGGGSGPSTPSGGDGATPPSGGPPSGGAPSGPGAPPVSGGPSGPSAGPTGGSGPSAGGPTTGGGGGGGPSTPSGGSTTKPTKAGRVGGALPADHWTRWWYANRLLLLDMHGRVRDRQVATPSAADPARTRPELWRAQAQEALTLALSDDDEDVASGAAVALGKAGDAGDTASLVAVFANPARRQSVREAAALGLGLLPREKGAVDARSALELVAADEFAPDRLRGFALYALGMRGDAAAVPFLLDAANAPTASSWDVPTAAASALGLTRCPLTRDELERILAGPSKDKSKHVMRRVYAAHGLARLGDPMASPALRDAGGDVDENVRRAAILALAAVARADDVATTDFLIHTVHQDRDRACRSMAMVALARIGPDRALRELLWAYSNGDALERPFAVLGLGLVARRGRDAELAKFLLRELEAKAGAEMRGALCIGVGLAGDLDAAPLLRRIAGEQGDPDVRAQAAMALGLLGDRDGAPPVLRGLLRDAPSPAVQREAAFALGMLGDRDAEKILLDLVVDGSGVYVQGSAAVALGRIGGRESSAALVAMLKDKDKPGIARGMAAVALGLLLDRTDGRALAGVGADLDWYLLTPTTREILDIL